MRQFAWLDAKTKKFHRSRKPMKTNADLQAAIRHHSAKGDACYQSVYRFAEWKNGRPVPESAIIDRIYIDFDDADNPQNAIDDAAKIAAPHTEQWFSGKKGIGMLIRFNTASILPKNKKAVLRRFSKELVELHDLKTADPAVMGDLNRVHRCLNTRHQDTGLYAIPLHQCELVMEISGIKRLAQKPRNLISTKGLVLSGIVLMEVEKVIEKECRNTELERKSRPVKRIEGDGRIGLIAHSAIEKLRQTGYLTHKERIGLVINLNELGWTEGEIRAVFRLATDYDPSITNYQVHYILHDWKR